MKFKPNEKYSSMAIYACIISALIVTIIVGLIRLESVVGIIRSFLNCLNPIFIGFFTAYLVNPTMRFLENRVFRFRRAKKEHPRLRRVLSLITAYLFYIVILGSLVALAIPQVTVSYRDLVSQLSVYASSAGDFIEQIGEWFPFLQTDKLTEAVQSFFSDTYTLLLRVTPFLSDFVGSLISSVTDIFLGLILSVYFLMYRDRLCAQCRKISYAFLNDRARGHLFSFIRTTDVTFGGFIRAKLLDSLIIGVLTFVVLAIFRMPYFPLIAVIVGVTNIIPFFGPFIGAIPSALMIFISDPGKTVWFLIIILVIQQLDGNLIGPKIMGPHVGLSSLGVIIAITLMGGLFGFGGMFLGVPLFALLCNLGGRFLEWLLRRKGLDRDGNPVAAGNADTTDAPKEQGSAEEIHTPSEPDEIATVGSDGEECK